MNKPSDSKTIVVTGASGLIGTQLTGRLESDGWHVVRAVRRPAENSDSELQWDPAGGTIDRSKLEGVDAVVHLAGENISGHRWTDAFKQRILHSRTNGTLLISETLASLEHKPKVFCCASAIGYYGNRGDEILTESAAPAGDFLADVCRQWEAACQPARDAGIRVVNTRIGVVLSPKGGALAKMLTPFKLGAGGVIGSGNQYMSWIALDDATAAIEFAVNTPEVEGPVNLVAPHPVANRQFTKTLGATLSRPTVFPMPAFAARLAFGEMADALLLSSTRVEPLALQRAGFQFQYPQLDAALRHLLDG